ncbi:MAG: glycoside hydrolase family 20 zincin-like fold domain-containing protein [Paludibacter sp.]|jgi:hypothetical protein|nr:glycoside hydrolase family 20 zincin-like fold domain-containing protein [Paludibacter sp.]
MKNLLIFTFCAITFLSYGKAKVNMKFQTDRPEIAFGAEKLKSALMADNNIVTFSETAGKQDFVIEILVDNSKSLSKEGYTIVSDSKHLTIKGNDASGALYACIDLAKMVESNGVSALKNLNIAEQPEMVLRGTCIGVQKPYYLPGRGVYEYPYTPETFPWFYDKTLWIEYLDMLVENKMNTLYLWNGHPFASLVKLNDYPFAVEVNDETFKKNEEMFAFLTSEAQKRGIWVIQMFYNILVSKPFAEHYGIKTQDRSRPITPLISDYTRKSIAAFIEKYPNVGLLVCLGEAMATYEDDVEWFTKTIIPGVQDGMQALKRSDEPPIVLRAHDTNCKMVMDAALPIYKNLYTMHKYNGESLTTYEPRGAWTAIHQELSALGSIHIENVHILANLEPFRYGSPDFIQKTVSAMHQVHGANALHLYPQASYWDYPYSADNTETRLKEIDRNWIWYQAWARYAWNVHRDRNSEIQYWADKFGKFYGTNTNYGKDILEAYEQSGEIAPKILRKFGITEGNRQTLLLGMFMSQLVNPTKYTVYEGFHSSCGPVGETITQFMEKEWKGETHEGELPEQLIAQAVAHGEAAVTAIDKAAQKVTKNKAEFIRLQNDMYCYRAFAQFFAAKVKAAMLVLQYTHDNDVEKLEKAVPLIENSIDYYKQLVDLTKNTYLYANSMQTAQRRIPVSGGDAKNKTWQELLPQYEKELADFKKNVEILKKLGTSGDRNAETLIPMAVEWDMPVNTYRLDTAKFVKVFDDEALFLGEFAAELAQLTPLRFTLKEQRTQGTTLKFTAPQDVTVLVGYINSERAEFAKAPTLEIDANANQYGQADVKIVNAFEIPKRGSVNVHAYNLPKGKNELSLGKGGLFVLGIIAADQKLIPHNANVGGTSAGSKADWLFY